MSKNNLEKQKKITPKNLSQVTIEVPFLAVFRIRIRIRSDPYHLAGSGSGSVSGNVDLDPGTKTKS